MNNQSEEKEDSPMDTETRMIQKKDISNFSQMIHQHDKDEEGQRTPNDDTNRNDSPTPISLRTTLQIAAMLKKKAEGIRQQHLGENGQNIGENDSNVERLESQGNGNSPYEVSPGSKFSLFSAVSKLKKGSIQAQKEEISNKESLKIIGDLNVNNNIQDHDIEEVDELDNEEIKNVKDPLVVKDSKQKFNESDSEEDEKRMNDDEKEEIDRILESRNNKQENTVFQLIFASFFIIHFLMEINLGNIFGMRGLIIDQIFDKRYNVTSQLTMMNVSRSEDLENTLYLMIGNLYSDNPNDKHVLFDGADTSQPQKNQQGTDSAYPLYATTIGKYNYFVGMRISTINVYKKSTSADADIHTVQPQITEETVLNIGANLQNINKVLEGYTYQDKGGFEQKGGFVQYFQGNMSRTEALSIYTEMTNHNWFENNMAKTSVEVMFYNKNTEIGLISAVSYFQTSPGPWIINYSQQIFMPQNYLEITSAVIIKLTLYVCFMLGLLTLLLKTIWEIIMKVKNFFKTQQLDLPWYIYIDLIVIASCSISVGYWGLLFLSRVSAIGVILMAIRNLRVLTTKFPAFGVLFDTLSKAKTDLMYFCIFVFTLSIGLMCLSVDMFGYQSERFSTMGNTAMSLFQMLFANFYYQQMREANPLFAPIIFIIFVLFFLYIVMNMFSAIVVKTYDQLRQKKQVITEAMADILANETSEEKRKWLSFICCRMQEIKNDEEDEEGDGKIGDEEAAINKIFDVLQQDQNDGNKVADPSFKNRCLSNFNQLKRTIHGSSIKTREQFEKELLQAKKKIDKRKLKDRQRRKERFQSTHDKSNYDLLKSSLLFLIFIGVFVSMLIKQLNHKVTQNAKQPIYQYLTTTNFTQLLKYPQNSNLSSNKLFPSNSFFQIQDVNDVLDFTHQVYFPFIYKGIDDLRFNSVAGSKKSSINFRFFNLTYNDDEGTNSVFPQVVPLQSLPTYSPANPSKFLENNKNFYSIRNNISMVYTEGDAKHSDPGGYGFYLGQSIDEVQPLIDKIYTENWNKHGLASIELEFIVYNSNYQSFIYNKVLFPVDDSGRVSPQFYSSTLSTNHFSKKNALLIVLEIVYIIFILYYTICELGELKGQWNDLTEEELRQFNFTNESKCTKILIYIGINFAKMRNKSIVIIAMKSLLGIIAFMIRQLIKLIKTFWRHYAASLYNLLDTVSIQMSIQIIVYWAQIISFPSLPMNDDGTLGNILPPAYALIVLQNSQRIFQTFNVFLIFFRMLQYFAFSKKLSTFNEILNAAKYDILFFVLMFSIITFGYAIAGYALFGCASSGFSSILMSFFSLIRFLMQDFNYQDLYNADSFTSSYYFVSYMFLFKISLLNMFIAIIVAHYNEFQRESQEEDTLSFFSMIFNILKNNLFKEEDEQNKCLCFKCKGLNMKWLKCLFKENIRQNTEEDNQQEEQENMKQVLRERVELPNMRDYHMHQGIKPYFTGFQNFMKKGDEVEFEKTKSGMMNNVAIFNRIMEQGENGHDNQQLNNANFLLYCLEESLLRMTHRKLSLYDFQAEKSVYTPIIENISPEGMTKFQKQFLIIDKKDVQNRLKFFNRKEHPLSVEQKFEIWQALDFEKLVRVLLNTEENHQFSLLNMLQSISEDTKFDKNLSIQFKLFQSSAMFKQNFNLVTKFQHQIWTQELTKEEQYQFWFVRMTSIERVRLWNKLVFSENYFNYVANNARFQRNDIKYILRSIQDKIQKMIRNKKGQRSQFSGIDLTKTELSEKETKSIRDQIYNNKVMLFIWNELKKRRFTVPLPKDDKSKRKAFFKKQAPKRKITLSKNEYMDMMKSMFNLMVKGLSHDRVKTQRSFQRRNGKEKSYYRLKEYVFDDKEYRLSLWLPLTLEQKLDMMMHQRIQEELEIMVFIFDEEYSLTKNLTLSQRVDTMLERAFDQQIFEKYMSMTRLFAMYKSIELCNQRIDVIKQEDKEFMTYAKFLHEQMGVYDTNIEQLKVQVKKKQRKNKKIEEKSKQGTQSTNMKKKKQSKKLKKRRNSQDDDIQEEDEEEEREEEEESQQQKIENINKNYYRKNSLRKAKRQESRSRAPTSYFLSEREYEDNDEGDAEGDEELKLNDESSFAESNIDQADESDDSLKNETLSLAGHEQKSLNNPQSSYGGMSRSEFRKSRY